MNLRSWATPFVLGALTLSSVTGALLFFEADTAASKAAHEWLGWALVGGAVAHAFTNRRALAAHLAGTRGRVTVGLFLLFTLAVSLPWPAEDGGGEPSGGGDGGGLLAAEYALTHVSLDRLAPLAGRDASELVERLHAAGFEGAEAAASIDDFAEGGGARDRALGVVFSPD